VVVAQVAVLVLELVEVPQAAVVLVEIVKP
jgi:hypothetical protein